MRMTKEKRDIIVNSLYDRFSKGEISREQREKLIQKTNSMFVATESVDQHDESTEQAELTPMEMYNIFKESVYEKYANKEITIEMRESLLEKARDKFLPISE